MRVSTQEEYGLRCLMQIARNGDADGLTIPEIAAREGLSPHQVAKILRVLRLNHFIESARGKNGGYLLAQPADTIIVADILKALGGKLYDSAFCIKYSGTGDICRHSSDCNVRLVWTAAQELMDAFLGRITLAQMLDNEAIRQITSSVRNESPLFSE